MLPETSLVEPLDPSRFPALLVQFDPSMSSMPITTASQEFPKVLHSFLGDPEEVLANYPTLLGYLRADPLGQSIQWDRADSKTLNLRWNSLGSLPTRVDYRGFDVALPATSDGETSMHPLLAWWAVLYTLSMLARYQPAEWSALIDINGSQEASAIECLLDEALDAVPDLIDRVLAKLAAADQGSVHS